MQAVEEINEETDDGLVDGVAGPARQRSGLPAEGGAKGRRGGPSVGHRLPRRRQRAGWAAGRGQWGVLDGAGWLRWVAGVPA
jgi:hypothetical protein